jgi:Secretion system C-terminal sorting domain
MKNFTLSIAMLLLSVTAFSQENPCPDIQSHGYGFVSVDPNNPTLCSAKVFVWATGDISSQKGLKIQVYQGLGGTGTLLAEVCHIVPKLSPTTKYETGLFTAPCTAQLSYVITRYTASNGTCQGGTCGAVYTINGGTLPIKLSSFFAKRNGNSVNLTWTSETEINAKEYVVERNSGSGFVAVGTVPAVNNGTSSSYSFVDNNTSKTISQYRLKLVDKDASSKLSETRAVKGIAAVSDFTVYPNPSVGFAKITISDLSEATNVEVIDNAGRVVRSIELKNSNNVQVNNLQSGIYLVRITNKATGDAITKKLTVSN